MGLFSRAKAFFSGSANDQYQYALPGGIEFITVTDGAGNVTAELHSSNEHRDAYYSNAFRACELAKCRPLASLPVHVYRRRDGVRRGPPLQVDGVNRGRFVLFVVVGVHGHSRRDSRVDTLCALPVTSSV